MRTKPSLSISVSSSSDSREVSPSPTRRKESGQAAKSLGTSLRKSMAELRLNNDEFDVSPKSEASSVTTPYHTPNHSTFEQVFTSPMPIAKGAFGSVRIATPKSDQLQDEHGELVLKQGRFHASLGDGSVHQEITALEKLKGINAPRLVNQEMTDDGYRLLMTRAPGSQLNHFYQSVIEQAPAQQQMQLLKSTVIELLKGLQNLHNNDVCHRDIKPGNVFVFKGKEDKILVTYIDFGDASSIDKAAEGASGTVKYSLSDKSGKTAAEIDLYSIGRMLAEVTGQIPELKIDFDRQEASDLSEQDQTELLKPTGEQAPTQESFINSLCYKSGMTLSEAINHPWLQS